jgi:hypothetical protein
MLYGAGEVSADREYLVIHISSNDSAGAAFWKIEEAISIASASTCPR